MKKILTLILGFTLLVSASMFAQGNDCSSATSTNVGANLAPAATALFNPNSPSVDGSPSCDNIGINYDSWFTFVAPASGVLRMEEVMTTGPGDFEVAVYAGTCGSLTEVYCDNSTFRHTHIVTGLVGGNTYYLQVMSDNAFESGQIALDDALGAVTCNNVLPNATAVSGSGQSITETQSAACVWLPSTEDAIVGTMTLRGGPSQFGSDADGGLWYTFTAGGCAANLESPTTFGNGTNDGGGAGSAPFINTNICLESGTDAVGFSIFEVTQAGLVPVTAGATANLPGAFFFNRGYCQGFQSTCGKEYAVFAGYDQATYGAPSGAPQYTITFEGAIIAPVPDQNISCIREIQASIDHTGVYALGCDDLGVDGSTHATCDVTIVSVDGDTGDAAVGSNLLNCTHVGKDIYAMVTVGDMAMVCDQNTGCPNAELVFNHCWSKITVEDKIAPVVQCPPTLVLDCDESAVPGAYSTVRYEVRPNMATGPGANTTTNVSQVVPNLGNVNIIGVNIYMDIDMESQFDYIYPTGVTLSSPAGTTFDVYPINLNPACQTIFGGNGPKHGFDDASAQNLQFCQDLQSGNDLLPLGTGLDPTFAGENPAGVWTWAVTDRFDLQGGLINHLVIEIEYANALETAIVTENCSYDLSYTDINDTRNICGIGQLTRVWTAVDASGLSGSCNQTIVFNNITPPVVTFPRDYEVECFVDISDLDPEDLPRPFDIPRWNEGDCEQFADGHTDTYFDICSPYSYKIRRTWEILDWCNPTPGWSLLEVQIIKVTDFVKPEITCPGDQTYTLRHNDCFTNVSLPSVGATDNCDVNPVVTRALFDADGNQVSTVGVPVGEYRGRYIATDACGNEETCWINVHVIDPVAPVITTHRHLVVSLTSNGWGYLCADQVDNGSNDNCTDVGLQIRRDDEANWKYYDNEVRNNNCVRYQCRDLGDNIVWLRVWDDAEGNGTFGPQDDTTGDRRIDEDDATGDNYNEGWAEVTVEDKLPPVLVCPPDVSLNCATDFDDLTITGEADANLNCARGNATYTDVVVHAYCPGTDVIRTWRVEKVFAGHDGVLGTDDDFVRERSCVQTITVTDDTPVVIARLPLDLTIECDGGAVGTEPADLTRYNYFDDYLNTPTRHEDDTLVVFDRPVVDFDCEHIGVNKTDKPFGLCLPGSYKVKRTWTVVDWCDDNYEFIYTHTIFVQDNDKPTLTVNNPGTVLIENNSRDCAEYVDLTATAFDLCSNVTITNNSPYGPGTHDASGYYPKGTFTITFTAVDGCGNVETEEINLTVVDGKAPTALCIYGLAIGLKASCEVSFDASDLNAGSHDNCTDDANLSYEIAIIDANGDHQDRGETIVFTCDNVGNQEVALIVTDAAGNEAVCNTVIQVQVGSCTDVECGNTAAPTVNVTGSITTEQGTGIVGVEMFLDGNSTGMANGSFGMLIDANANTGMAQGVIEALKEDDVDNGVNILDLITIRRHILQLAPLSSAYAMIAANVNADANVNTLDMIQIRQAILKQIDEYTNVPSWQFVDAEFIFASNPFATAIPFYVTVDTNADIDVNLIGIKMGDVNGDADATIRTSGSFVINTASVRAEKGQEVSMAFTSEMTDVAGYQFTIEFDASALELINIEGNVSDKNFNYARVAEGIIAVATEEVSSELFTMNFVAIANTEMNEAINITSGLTKANAYDRSGNALDIKLNFVNTVGEYALYQNAPNPFTATTIVGFNMAEAGSATLRVLDITGKVVFENTIDADKGNNTIELNKSDLGTTGIMYYQLEAGEFVATKKMIMIK